MTSSPAAGRSSSSASRTRVAALASSSASAWARSRVSCAPSAVTCAVAWNAWSTAVRTCSARLLLFLFFLATPRRLSSLAVPVPGIHVHPTTELAPRVLLPGDPGRALALAQLLLDGPKMFNHHRGLWGYTGPAADGELLTVQATGMGGPSAAIVLEELIDMGVTEAIRVGTCGALVPELALGELVVAAGALAADGTSRALGADGVLPADPGYVAALAQATGTTPRVAVSTDVFYERDRSTTPRWRAAGADVVEMEAAALLRVGELRGIRVGCVLAVSDRLADGGRERLDADGLVAAGAALGHAAVAGLGIPPLEGAPARGLVDPELEAQKARRERAAATDGAG
ncbi:hypothetical protein GKE82_22040 [Conexibacter sp. W3-3-2]|nr:hypothetical protein [Conexibacter sp. W3-3-2]